MARSMPSRRILMSTLAAAAWALAAAVPAAAASGRVVDERGNPIADASACLMAEGAEVQCVSTDSMGRFALLPTRHPSIRVRRSGYMPVTVANVDQESPIVLPLAATIRVRVVESTTAKPPRKRGTMALVFPDGRIADDFPLTEAGEIVIRPVRPGGVRVRVRIEGYDDGGGSEAVLEAGKETEVIVKVRAASSGGRN